MRQFPQVLSVAALSVALIAGPLAAAPATTNTPGHTADAISQVQPASADEASPRTVLATEHTDALAVGLANGQLDLFTFADLPGAPHTRLDPAQTTFNLQDRPETRVQVPAGFDFLGEEGKTIWLAPQTQIAEVLWPGWNTESIRPGELAGDTINLELVRTKAPEGGAVEIFQSSPFGISRIFSSSEKLPTYQQPVGAHVHANWAFTATGTYELTFQASATRTDGTSISAEQTYTFVVGQLPDDSADQGEQPQPETLSPAPEAPAPTSAPEVATPASPAPSAPAPAPEETSAAPAPTQDAAETPSAPETESAAPAGDDQTSPATQPEALPPVSNPNQAHQTPDSQAPASQAPAQSQPLSGSTQQNPAPQKCQATEELIKPAQQAQASDEGTINRASAPTLEKPAFTIQRAVDTRTDRATSGHFDFGAVLNGGNLSAQIKDDRTSPAIWKQPSALTFVLGDGAKTTMPGGMEHIAPAGSEVYLIGATQQATVPWVGWNTQNPELVAQAAGPATLTLTDMQGPGQLSVFLSGNFGSAGTTVFNKVGDSFSVPLNTHQHGNWVFTAPGIYTATLTWSAPLKNGQQVSSSGTLTFEVGDVSSAQAPQQQGQPQEETQDQGKATQQDATPKSTADGEQKGSVDQTTGIVTRPDGSQVRIVGKTADGRDCTLSEEELKQAQQASARGELAYTGTSSVGTVVAAGALALLLGAGALIVLRRRSAGHEA
ncbi:MAG: TIGR03773 family transporter-associated surface protein [Rothia sp. (in: high G+C Gram-positive bacteria)]|nr:TIGR03773 family transporter-associated surface protein [Rothia sp. (in: high G+C Gram-positive bacteria)]